MPIWQLFPSLMIEDAFKHCFQRHRHMESRSATSPKLLRCNNFSHSALNYSEAYQSDPMSLIRDNVKLQEKKLQHYFSQHWQIVGTVQELEP